MSTICFYAQFVASKVGANGITVTWDVEQVTRSDGTRSALVTGGATTITVGRRGLYGYRLASADLSLYDYVATAITADTSVDQREIAAIGMVLPDAPISEIAPATLTALGSAGNLDSQLNAINAKTTNLPASPAGTGDAMMLAANAVTAAAIAADAGAEIAVAVADAVLDEAMSGHTTPGTAGAALAAAGSAGDPWITDLINGDYNDPDTAGYIVARLAGLDVSAVTQVAASSAGHLTITAGLTFDESVSGLTISADWWAAIWTLKANVRDADTAALVQMRVTNPAAVTDGLQRVNGAAPAAPIAAADGELTVNQAGGSITIWLSDELTALLAAAVDLGWDVKFIDLADDSSGQRGTADVVLTETRATT